MAKSRYEKEILTDNTKINYCEQCKDCILWGFHGDPYQNAYDKTNCMMYPYPDHKPGYVINNQGPCSFRVEKE